MAPSTINYQTIEGYSTIVLSNLPKVANLSVRITLITNTVQEIWVVDNVTLFGRKELTSTWDGTAWSNGQPTSGVKAILDADYSTGTQGDLLGCKCQINVGKTLTIDPATYAIIESDLQSSGTIIIENTGSLVQRNDFAVNSGNLIVKRTTAPMKLYDYTYWSSPVGGQTLTNLSPQTSRIVIMLLIQPAVIGNLHLALLLWLRGKVISFVLLKLLQLLLPFIMVSLSVVTITDLSKHQ